MIFKSLGPGDLSDLKTETTQTISALVTGWQKKLPFNEVSEYVKQELSYRKQIARLLRTQFVEGIHRPKYYTVTLKSRLRVTRRHWKRIHWTDRTRLTISRVI